MTNDVAWALVPGHAALHTHLINMSCVGYMFLIESAPS